jgi:probable rRNA maturation factor
MIEVVNRQRKFAINPTHWQTFAEQAIKVSPAGSGNVAIAFVSDRAMAELNRRWRGKRGTTDVLSFPRDQDGFGESAVTELGDIAISVQQAARQAKENGLTLENEISQLILHGLLHLCGYDHSTDHGEMDRLELKLRRKLGI